MNTLFEILASSDALIKNTPSSSMFMNIVGVVVILGIAVFIYKRYSKKEK